MIFLRFQDILLKDEIELYNNVAQSGDCSGRLLAKLQIHPVPRILWEFESLGDAAYLPPRQQNGSIEPLVGHGFVINKPYAGGYQSGNLTGIPREVRNGVASEARYNDLEDKCHSFIFYLPNAQFQQANISGQGWLSKHVRKRKEKEDQNGWEEDEGRFLDVAIDNDWNVYLETRHNALTWLNPNQRNTGTRVTTTGKLYHPNNDTKSINNQPALSINDAIDLLSKLCQLLSFANGGYLGPLYVEGYRRQGDDHCFSASVLAFRTTPLEQLGSSWLSAMSDLEAFIGCFPTFCRMRNTPLWSEVFGLILEWYFQAIQPQSAQVSGKPWPIVANALGAGLERLCVTILVRELNIRGLGNLAERIETLLKQMGITKQRGYGDLDFVQTFVDLRNEATHPTPAVSISDDARNYVLRLAMQWIEETLLWRLGYNGKYRDFYKIHKGSTEPRYDLSTRDPSW